MNEPTESEITQASEQTGVSEAKIKKAIEKVEANREKRKNRLLKNLTPNEIWNEFSNSNVKLPRYDVTEEDNGSEIS